MKLTSSEKDKALNAVSHTLKHCVAPFGMNWDSAEQKKVCKTGGYNFIPFTPRSFTYLLIESMKYIEVEKFHMPKFVDCGCGVGWTLSIANCLGCNADGIEYNNDLIDIAKKHFSVFIQNKNLLEFKDYGKYDILYYYHPFSESDKQKIFEELLFENMRVGAVVISCRAMSEVSKELIKKYNLKSVGRTNDTYYKIFKKIK